MSRLSKTLGIWIDFSEAGPRGNGQVHCNPSRWVSSESNQPSSLAPSGWAPQLLDPTLMTPGLRPGIGRSPVNRPSNHSSIPVPHPFLPEAAAAAQAGVLASRACCEQGFATAPWTPVPPFRIFLTGSQPYRVPVPVIHPITRSSESKPTPVKTFPATRGWSI